VYLLPALVWMLTRSAAPQATPVLQADAQCGQCHQAIFRSYLHTPMANASGLAIDKVKPATFMHGPSGVTYTVSSDHGEALLSYHAPNGPGQIPLTYFLGSGHLGTTYLYFKGRYLFESPVAWYADSNRYDMKPGLTAMRSMPPPLPMESDCMRCHMSDVQRSDPGTINRYQGLPFLHAGITCEECHGDSRAHVLTGGKAGILNPAHLDPELRDSICISCHLEGDVSVQRAGHSVLNYRPGEAIGTYMAYYAREGANLMARGVSEVEQLSQSTCKRMSGDKMSCMSCHDPHYTPDSACRVAFYRSKCLACHNAPQFAKTHHPENQDCTSCHMPRIGARNILHVAWTDHRILRVPRESSQEPRSTGEERLGPIFSPGASARDLAMAYYKGLLQGNDSFEARAWNGLEAQKDTIQNDKRALDALGNLSAERGDSAAAERAYGRVLQLDPNDLTALSNFGILLARQGKLAPAIAMLKGAFARNQDVPGLAMNLARLQCMAHDGNAARDTLKTALVYAPGLSDLKGLLDQVSSCGSAHAR